METLSNLYNKLKEDTNREFVKTLASIYFIFIIVVFIFMLFIRKSSYKSPIQPSRNQPIIRRRSPIIREPRERYFVKTRPQFQEKVEKKMPSRFLISNVIN